MERKGYKGNRRDADGEQNEFGQGPGVDLAQGGMFTLSTEYTHDSSYRERQFEIRRKAIRRRVGGCRRYCDRT